MTREVLQIRKMESIYWAITVRHTERPGWWARLFGAKPVSWDRVYTGCYAWRDAATGERCEFWLESWLDDQRSAQEARDRYAADVARNA